jgi:hypothetical protein
MRRVVGFVLAAGLLLVSAGLALGQGDYGPPPAQTAPPAAQASNKAETQLRTAIDHAKNSAGSGAMASAVSHLGHVLNCIEGTRGKNFNSSWGHVCQGQGDGILIDIKGAKNADNLTLVLEAADSLATGGVKAKNLSAVQNAARGVGALLQIVLDGTK